MPPSIWLWTRGRTEARQWITLKKNGNPESHHIKNLKSTNWNTLKLLTTSSHLKLKNIRMLKLQLSYSGIAMQTRLSEIAHTLAFLLQDFITYLYTSNSGMQIWVCQNLTKIGFEEICMSVSGLISQITLHNSSWLAYSIFLFWVKVQT